MNKNRTLEISLRRISSFIVPVPQAGHEQGLEMRELFKTALTAIIFFCV